MQRLLEVDLLLTILHSLPHGLLVVDREGQLIFANSHAEELFAYPGGALTGQPLEALLPERFRAGHRAFRQAYFAAPEQRAMGEGRDLFGLRRDGTEFPIEIGLNPLSVEDDLLVVAAIVDITRRKEHELRLARAFHTAEEVNRELRQLTYGVSHDLTAPLRSISGFVQILKRKCAELDAGSQELIDRTVAAVVMMQEQLSQLRDNAAVDARSRPFTEVDLNEVMGTVQMALGASIEESGAEIHCDQLPFVLGDRAQLIQLFQNLVGNSIKYQQPGRTPKVRIGFDEFRFSVTDNGIGVPAEDWERVFILFERAHGQPYPGTGIGLSTCRKVVERHGGKIWVETSSTEGTQICFTLEAEKGSQREAKSDHAR
ncbi:MAG: ATP-binding protein [Vulcanimicrobiota bacterium]